MTCSSAPAAARRASGGVCPVLTVLRAAEPSHEGATLSLSPSGTAVLDIPGGPSHELGPSRLLALADVALAAPSAVRFAPGWDAVPAALPYLPFTAHVEPRHRHALAAVLMAANACGQDPATGRGYQTAKQYAADAASMGRGLPGSAPLGAGAVHDAISADMSADGTHLLARGRARGWGLTPFSKADRPPHFRPSWCTGCRCVADLGACNAAYGCLRASEDDPAWGLGEWAASNREGILHALSCPSVKVLPLRSPLAAPFVPRAATLAGDPMSALSVWFVAWPYGGDDSGDHPVVVVPVDADRALLVLMTSRASKWNRAGIDVPITDTVSTGLEPSRPSVVRTDAWAWATRDSLPRLGIHCGFVAGADAEAVSECLVGSFERWELTYHRASGCRR